MTRPLADSGERLLRGDAFPTPGGIHTLVVDELNGAGEMVTFFNIHGAKV